LETKKTDPGKNQLNKHIVFPALFWTILKPLFTFIKHLLYNIVVMDL